MTNRSLTRPALLALISCPFVASAAAAAPGGPVEIATIQNPPSASFVSLSGGIALCESFYPESDPNRYLCLGNVVTLNCFGGQLDAATDQLCNSAAERFLLFYWEAQVKRVGPSIVPPAP